MACAPAGVAASRLDGMVATEKNNFVAKQPKNTIVGVQTIKKVKKSRLCGVPSGDSGKPPPKSILIAICEVFLGGLLHPPYLYLALFSFIWLYLAVF